MGRKLKEPYDFLHVTVPRKLLKEVKLLNLNFVTGRVRHGSLSSLVSRLLSEWVEEQRMEYVKGKEDKDV